jgi:hypothetical protein
MGFLTEKSWHMKIPSEYPEGIFIERLYGEKAFSTDHPPFTT